MKNILMSLLQRLDVSGIQFQNFDPNAIAKTITNGLMGLAVVAGLIYGGWTFAQGIISDDPKEKKTGVTAMIGSLVVGGLVIVVVNMVLA